MRLKSEIDEIAPNGKQPLIPPKQLDSDVDGNSETTSLTSGSSGSESFDQNEETQKEEQSAVVADDPLILIGVDLSPLRLRAQFYISAGGVFAFTIIYSYLQELITVHVAGRKLSLFLSAVQFAGYSFWSFILLQLRNWRIKKIKHMNEKPILIHPIEKEDEKMIPLTEKDFEEKKILGARIEEDNDLESGYINKIDRNVVFDDGMRHRTNDDTEQMKPEVMETVHFKENSKTESITSRSKPSYLMYIALALVRAIDVGMTNGAMHFLNYPAKVLLKSSRVIFTMMFGIVIGKKRYSVIDYCMVGTLVLGLSIFLHADSRSDAMFHPIGVCMLVISLCCDAIVSNYSELIMNKHKISQDDFQLSIYSTSFVFTLVAASFMGELTSGIKYFLFSPGTISEIDNDTFDGSVWSVKRKAAVLICFTFFGLCGSSCAGAITKQFGALSMSITSTARKAVTLFISLTLPGFHNKCTGEHIAGIAIFLGALTLKNWDTRKIENGMNTEKKRDKILVYR